MDKEENIIETTEVVDTKETIQKEVDNLEENNKKGLSIASMVLGIVSILLGRNFLIAIACGVLAIIFGLKGKKMGGKGMAKAGFITGIIGVSLQLVLILIGTMLGLALIGTIGTMVH